MSLQNLNDDVEATYADLDDELSVEVGREAKHELAMLIAALDDDASDLVERAIHLLFQTSVDTAKLDFHLRGEYDVTYDEYLMGATMDSYVEGGGGYPQQDDRDNRRYQM